MTNTNNVVKITQNLPVLQLGRSRVSFSINLGDLGFRKFLSNLPNNQANYYEDRSEALKEPVVEVVLPQECMDSFDLSDPMGTLKEMRALSAHHNLNTTTYVLDRVVKAVGAV